MDTYPELHSGYDPEAFTAMIKRTIPQESRWSHKNGNVYTVMMLTNLESNDHLRYPPMVVYRGGNGHVWSRKASDWDRSMTRLPAEKKTAKRAVKAFFASLFVILSGCSYPVYPDDYHNAEVLCKGNGGLKAVVVNDTTRLDVYCKNTAKFVLVKTASPDRTM